MMFYSVELNMWLFVVCVYFINCFCDVFLMFFVFVFMLYLYSVVIMNEFLSARFNFVRGLFG